MYFGTGAGKAGVGADIAILDSGYYLSQVGVRFIVIYSSHPSHLSLTLLSPSLILHFSLFQIGLSLVMGRLVEMTGLPHYYIIVACVSGLGATLAANKVVFSPQDLK